MGNVDARRYPTVNLGAENLVIGHLQRRNILAYKAPQGHTGYDLICLHPDKPNKAIRVQVKSRYQTDHDWCFPLKEKSFGQFDYCVVVFLNNGYYNRKKKAPQGRRPPEFYTLPAKWVKKHHHKVTSGFQKVHLRGYDLSRYKDEVGFEQIARDLKIEYPG